MHDRSRTAALREPHPQHPHPDDADEPGRSQGPPPGLALDPPDLPPPSHPPEIAVERLDPEALRVIARLRHMHHRAYLVGGCVRDLLLGHKPKDFDVATDAHPGEVRAIFRNCRLIGRRFRLAHVYFRGGKVIEVATFRKNPVDVADDLGADGDLLITRDNVFGTAEEDAVRRDFTVNGLFYDVATGEVIDYVGGRADLESHRIHTIGDPEIRIREDPVRSLRAVRFAARLGFSIAPDTFEAMRRHAGELARCAPARVLEETLKILRCGGSARAFQLLRACGALPLILPALGAALEAWDEPARRSFFAHLGALDKLVRSGAEVSEAVLLATLVSHLAAVPPRGGAAEPPGPGQARTGHEADELVASLVSTSRLPRRVAERVRLALNAQRHLKDPGGGRRGRGRKMAGQTYYDDALQLLEIAVEATGQGAELLERWRQARDGKPAEGHPAERSRVPGHGRATHGAPGRGQEGGPMEVVASLDPEAPAAPSRPEGEGPAGPATGDPGRRRRRRRGGRRRRRRGDGGAAPAA
ncbi:MAG TPA: CCA tRNA nucleotidyltransferase [Anaeromyxobacter sp.]|nr:CCA tRNA nucleotidyltransferase [Anaeromyxobacter sp.]